MLGWQIFGGFVALLVILTVFSRLLVRAKGGQQRAQSALPAPKPRTCQKCAHWNYEEGQRTLRKNPAFFLAAQNLSPNTMSRGGVDAEGNPKKGASLHVLDDRWDHVGACLKHMECRFRTDTCDLFRSHLTASLFGLDETPVIHALPESPSRTLTDFHGRGADAVEESAETAIRHGVEP